MWLEGGYNEAFGLPRNSQGTGMTEDEANAVQGAYLAGVPLLQKPFTPARLAERVRVVLDTSHA